MMKHLEIEKVGFLIVKEELNILKGEKNGR